MRRWGLERWGGRMLGRLRMLGVGGLCFGMGEGDGWRDG